MEARIASAYGITSKYIYATRMEVTFEKANTLSREWFQCDLYALRPRAREYVLGNAKAMEREQRKGNGDADRGIE